MEYDKLSWFSQHNVLKYSYCSNGSLVEIVPRVAARAERCAGVNVQIDRVVPRPLHR